MTQCANNPCIACQKLQEVTLNYQTFISRLSHEIRNPLTLIYSSLQLLEKDYPGLSQDLLFLQIGQDIQNTIRLLKDVSSLNAQNSLRRSTFPVRTFLSGVADTAAPYMATRNIAFSVECDAALSPALLSADELKLREALTNLLVNAADAVAGSGNSGEIHLCAEPAGKLLALHVKDNGPGIPDEYLSTLFDPFVTHKANGTGLGLNIVKTIASQHGGSVTVQTCTDPGCSYTDFCLLLPFSVSARANSAKDC